MDGFTLLAFALCARMTVGMGQDLVEIGKIVDGACDTHYFFGDSNGDTASIYDHDIGVMLRDDGAVVILDGIEKFIPKLSPA